MEINDITKTIIGCAIKVHTRLGPGLLESTYQSCLRHELEKSGLVARSQVGLPLVYDGVRLETGYRIDLMVEDAVIVEIKAQEGVLAVHRAQLLSHLRLSGRQVGLLINFHVVRLKDGIIRMVNNYREPVKTSGPLS